MEKKSRAARGVCVCVCLCVFVSEGIARKRVSLTYHVPWALCLQEPYRLIYFVVADQMRTTIAVLRAILKEG